jgi:hypothetical protein
MILTLPANLATDGIFLLVQHDDFRTCQMAIVLTRHVSLFLSDLIILTMKLLRLTVCQVAFAILLIDATILIGQPAIKLRAPRRDWLKREVSWWIWRLTRFSC